MSKISISFFLLFMYCIIHQNANAINNSDEVLHDKKIVWSTVDSLIESKANADSIMNAIDSIYAIADNQKNIASLVKAIYYKSVLISTSRINGKYEAIYYLESEIKQREGILKPLLQSILADFYLKLANDYNVRINSNDSLTQDISLWSRLQLKQKGNELLEQSLKSTETKRIKIEVFDVFFDGQAYPERPTLFDYLAHFAIDNYKDKNSYRDIKFSPDLYSYYSFLKAPKPQHPILAIYYDLLKLHRQNKNQRAFIHTELKRLKELEHCIPYNWRNNLDSLYISSIDRLNRQYSNTDAQVEIIAEKVDFMFKYGNRYCYAANDYISSILNWKKLEDLLDIALARNINSPASEKCRNLKKNLSASYLHMEMQNEFPPNKPIQAKISFRKISKLNIAIEGANYQETYSISTPKWKGNSYYQYDSITLSNGLPTGKYTLTILGGYDTDTLKIPVSISEILSFGIGLNDSIIGLTVDRTTGLPIPNTNLTLSSEYWKDKKSCSSNDQGFYYFKNPVSNHYFEIEANSIKTKLSNWSESKSVNTIILTDRSIYRPGQEVHYKIIATNQDNANNFSNVSISTVNLKLPNNTTIKDDQVATHEEDIDSKYSIAHGKFKIPENTALGDACLQVSTNRGPYGDKRIYIEEYKRPTFEVKIDSLLWDSISGQSYVVGSAQGYAGFAIDSAKVEISIKEPFDSIILCQTNYLGHFNAFISDTNRYHSFDVKVTGRSGETHVAQYSGYVQKPFSVKLSAPDTVYFPGNHNLWINTNNYYTSGIFGVHKLINQEYLIQQTIPYSGKRQADIPIESAINTPGSYRITYQSQGKQLASIDFKVIFREDERLVFLNKKEYLIGDTAVLTIHTPEKTYPVLFIEKGGEISDVITIDSSFYQYRIPITDYSPIGYWVFYAKNNEIKEFSGLVEIAERVTRLNIQLVSYRNKLQPNSKEGWRIRVTDFMGKPVVADITASMYDASLDSYRKNVWLKNSLFYKNRLLSRSFQVMNSSNRTTLSDWYEVNEKRYCTLMGWNLSIQKPSKTKIREQQIPEFANDMPQFPDDLIAISDIETNSNFRVKNFSFDIPIRKNLDETIFFYPNIRTDSLGFADISFTMKESLTRWRLMLFALSKDMYFGFSDAYAITQLPLMIKPNPPRFFREDDLIHFTTSIINSSDSTLTGIAQIEFFDIETFEIVNDVFLVDESTKPFTVESGRTTNVQWKIKVPKGKYNSIGYRVKAITNNLSDGEENALPIISNRELISESYNFNVSPQSRQRFIFKQLLENKSSTSENYKLEFNLVKNPTWDVLAALPYLINYPHECSEQLMSRLYSNILALEILKQNPDIQKLLDKWRNNFSTSPLSESPELNSILKEEAPWYKDPTSEADKKAHIAKQFDHKKLHSNIESTIKRLTEIQLPSGGFSWMEGGPVNTYISQLIVEQIRHLQMIGVDISKYGLTGLLERASNYSKTEFLKAYTNLIEEIETGKKQLEAFHLTPLLVHQLYSGSYFTDKKTTDVYQKAIAFYKQQCIIHYRNLSPANQAMAALFLYRNEDVQNAEKMIEYLEKEAYRDDNLGIWWNYEPWHWQTQPIESQAVMIEAFNEIKKDKQTVELLKKWLLRNKEANRWASTKATVAATYALLTTGDKTHVDYKPIEIKIGGEELIYTNDEDQSNRINKQWFAQDISNEKGQIWLKNPNAYATWGGMVWSYFENIDKVGESQNNHLTITKRMYKVINGERIQLLDNSVVSVGDKIIVQLEINAQRDMQYLFLKDLRASGFEPDNLLSGYRWDENCPYHLKIRDASVHFFFDSIKRGKHVVEYTLYANLEGSYNNGYAAIECMYAPFIRSRADCMQIRIEK